MKTLGSLIGIAILLHTGPRTALAQSVAPSEAPPPSTLTSTPPTAPGAPPAPASDVGAAPSVGEPAAPSQAPWPSTAAAAPRLVWPASRGQVCGSRAECLPGLRCLKNVCVEERAYLWWLAERAQAEDKYAPAGQSTEDASNDATRVYLGGAIGGMFPVVWANAGGPYGGVGEGVQLAFRFGALVYGRIQFQLEVSPVTTVLSSLAQGPIGMFEATGSVAYLIPMSDMVSWVLRMGGGGGALLGGGFSTTGFAEFRADVLGVAIRTSEHLLIEFNVPSFRVIVPVGSLTSLSSSTPGLPTGFSVSDGFMLHFVTSMGVTYLF